MNAGPPFLFGSKEIGPRHPVSENIIVQFVGFQAKPLSREYTFTVRERETEPREYVIAITNAAFDSRRVRYQDAPDVCSLKLKRELITNADVPSKTNFPITDAELDDYRMAHTSKAKAPWAPKPKEDF